VKLSRAAALVTVLASITAPRTVTAEQRVWRWFQKCDPVNAIAVEVRLDATLLYRASFPICHVDASDVSRQDPRILKFSFKPGRRVLWSGYRENHDTTDATQQIEGVLLLGVSFATKDTIVMNTLHIADTTRRSQTEIVKGLRVATFPTNQAETPGR